MNHDRELSPGDLVTVDAEAWCARASLWPYVGVFPDGISASDPRYLRSHWMTLDDVG